MSFVTLTDKELNARIMNMRDVLIDLLTNGSNKDLKIFDQSVMTYNALRNERDIRLKEKEAMYRATHDAYLRWLKARADYGS